MPTAKPSDFVRRLRANVDDLYADRISHEEHGRRNRIIWDEITAAGMHTFGMVAYMLRKNLGKGGI